MAHECQNPTVPCGNVQQFPSPPAQGFNVHAETFAPTHYHETAPLISQLVMTGPMLSFSQASGPQRAPMLTNARHVKNDMAQGPVTVPGPGQELLN